MRKCVFKKITGHNDFPTAYGTNRVPIYEDSEPGLFHQWGVQYEELENGPGNYSVAIIEMPGGTIETQPAHNVRFLDAPNDH